LNGDKKKKKKQTHKGATPPGRLKGRKKEKESQQGHGQYVQDSPFSGRERKKLRFLTNEIVC